MFHRLVFISSSFRNLDFNKADFDKINGMLSETNWDDLINTCPQESFPELFSLTVLQICEQCCPKKIPPKSTLSRAVNVPSRKKRKIQSQLAEAENNPHAPPSQIASLQRKLALAHISIRDAINNDLLYREQQAVSKIKDNPKYFYSYAKKFSRKRSNISMLFDKNGAIKSNPTDIANLLQQQFLQGWRNRGGQGGHGPPKNLSGWAKVCFGPPKILTTGPPKIGGQWSKSLSNCF